MPLLVEGPLDPAEVEAEVRTPGAGAVVVFVGTVRGDKDGRKVVRLFYEAYATMAEKRLAEIAEAAREKHGALRVALRHRVGDVAVGDVSVVVAVSAAHRAQAFDACRDAMEAVKASAPLWKKEYFEDGSEWVGQGS